MKEFVILLFFTTVSFFPNHAYSEEYKTIRDIQFDGTDAVGKKAHLCVYILDVNNTMVGVQDKTDWMNIERNPNNKNLFKKMSTTASRCTEIVVKIIGYQVFPVGELISVGETRDRRRR